ncbi:MAG: MFS transporter [Desulfotomaculaceae bacterium]
MKMNKKALALLGTGHSITDINQGALPIMLVFLQPVFALTQLQVGMVMLAFNLSSSVIQPIFGILSDRFRAAWLVPAGCLISGLGMAFTGFSPNFPTLLLAALISGLGVAAFHPEGSKFARLASGDRKASGMSMFSVGGNLGFAAGPILASLFFGLAGLGGSAGFFVINGTMAAILWVYLASFTGSTTTATAPTHTQTNKKKRSTNIPEVSAWFLFAPVALLVTVVIMRSFTHFGMVTFLPQYYVHHLQQSEAQAATLTSIFLFAGVFGTLVGGPAADRWGLKTVIVTSMSLLVPILYLFTKTEGILLVALVALAGFAAISTFAVTVVFAQELLPGNVGLASGLVLGFAIGMGGVGATALGWVADNWGLPTVFHVMMLFPVIGLLLALLLPNREQLARRTNILNVE